MIKSLKINRLLWFLVSILSLVTSAVSILNQSIYNNVVIAKMLPGAVSQDIISLLASLFLMVLVFIVDEKNPKKQIMALSMVAYLFYGYGVYVIEQIYNSFYLMYMAIFASSFWSLVYGLICIDSERIGNIYMSGWAKNASVSFLVIIPVLFYSIWISKLLPLMHAGKKAGFAYSIPILDMAFLLPAFLISAVLITRNNNFGLIFAPIIFIKAFTLLFSVGLGYLISPLYGQLIDSGETVFYVVLAAVFLLPAVIGIVRLEFLE